MIAGYRKIICTYHDVTERKKVEMVDERTLQLKSVITEPEE
jgi:hypothetical protein